MGIFDIFSKKKPSCCTCSGGAPSFSCNCHCHAVEDVEFWEPIAYTWICDAEDEIAREEAWHRFCQAYPEHGHGTCSDFWEHIHKTRWHHKHGHECHHRHHGYF